MLRRQLVPFPGYRGRRALQETNEHSSSEPRVIWTIYHRKVLKIMKQKETEKE